MFVSTSSTTVCVLMLNELPYLEDLAFVKGLLSLFFNLYFALTNPINMLLELCQDIHSELGDIDPVHRHRNVYDIPLILRLARFHLSVIELFLGVCGQDVEVDKQCHFAIVNAKTATTVAVSVGRSSGNNVLFISSSSFASLFALQLLVTSQVDRVLDEVDWLIARKKSQATVNKSGSGRRPLPGRSFTVLCHP